MRRKNVKVSNFFKVMPTATSYNYLARWEKLKSFLAFKVSQGTKFLCEYHIPQSTAIQKVAIRGLTFEMFRVGTTLQGAILPAWQTELQRNAD